MSYEFEVWRPIPGCCDLYDASSLGRVRSRDRIINRSNGVSAFSRGRILSASPNSHGRPTVVLYVPGNPPKTCQVAQLVAAAFLGPRPPGLGVLHWDDDPLNNRTENLRYGTASENQYDRVRNGNHPSANKTECKWGHRFTPENTYIYAKSGLRACKQCMRDRRKSRYAMTGS